MPTALITGVSGQDGSYLAELLLGKGYRVVGLDVRSTAVTFDRIQHILDQIDFVYGDLSDQGGLVEIVERYQPDEVYNFASVSFVPMSWQQPVFTGEINAQGVTRLLEAIRLVRPQVRFYQASSSEMFGRALEIPQRETTPFCPRTPYGVTKLFGHWITHNYREFYKMFAVSGILYNHESPRRGLEFVTRKITHTAARIRLGLDKELRLGNLESRRDWGFAGDYVEAMWRMLQAETPDDYVIGAGETHTVREFCELAFGRLGLDYRAYVVQDPRFYRPVDPELLVADPTKARQQLGWTPKVSFAELVTMMVDADLKRLAKEIE
jgi:GDPmannose 4,6-dehydratase